MYVIDRKVGEKIRIGEDVLLTVSTIDKYRCQVHLGFDAPRSVLINRKEVHERNKTKYQK